MPVVEPVVVPVVEPVVVPVVEPVVEPEVVPKIVRNVEPKTVRNVEPKIVPNVEPKIVPNVEQRLSSEIDFNKMKTVNNIVRKSKNNNKDSYGLLITTNKKYYNMYINILIKQLEIANFPKDNILIVCGQSDRESVIIDNGIKVVNVKYTGLHLTGLIYISENINKYNSINYWLALPDTVVLGKNIYNLFLYYVWAMKQYKLEVLPIINPRLKITMDIGIFTINHICKMKEYLSRVKILNPNKEAVHKLKIQLMYNENIIFGLHPFLKNKATYLHVIDTPPTKFIINDIGELKIKYTFRQDMNGKIYRSKDTFVSKLDIVKIQRNYLGSGKTLLLD